MLSLREPARPNWRIGGYDSKYVCMKASLYKYNSAGVGLQDIVFHGIISFAFSICLISYRGHGGLCHALSPCFRAISMLGIIINALSHSSDLMTFISFTLATFQTWKYNIQPHIWTSGVITFFSWLEWHFQQDLCFFKQNKQIIGSIALQFADLKLLHLF